MNVTPQISDGDMVTINVRPTVTRIIGSVNDPNPALAAARVTSVIPVTQTREMESVLKVASGQTAVLGGLMLDSFEGRREGLPIASRIPIFGDLVSNRNDQATKSELVIFIRPVVIREASMEGDLAEYRRYLPTREFFKDTVPPMPRFQEGMRQIEAGEMPSSLTRPTPVVPEALAPSPGGPR
jgi:general secretion pathway protein D